jgi:GntR family transcriptional regulator
VQRDAGSGPPRPDWAHDWAARLSTLLAEAAAQGLPPEDIVRHCREAIAAFTFPAAGESGPGSVGQP